MPPLRKNASDAHASKKSLCYDAAKIIEPKLDDTQCGFCRGRSTAEEISTLQQTFQEILETCQRLTHVLSTSGKHMAGFPMKSLGLMLWEYGVDGCLLLDVK